MKKKVLLVLVAILAIGQSTFASYDFSAVASSGQTLFYNINSTNPSTVTVTFPGSWAQPYSGHTEPTGNLTIPSSVTYSGTTYSIISIGNSAFYHCSGLTSVTIPNSVTSIGSSAFSGCSGLTSVTIPDSVTTIENNAFHMVRHIEYYGSATGSPWGSISMNGVTEGDFVYSDATKHKLTAYVGTGGVVSIPSTVDTIGNDAFYNCSGLTSVTIPNSVTSIGDEAFRDCSGLTSVTIPNSVTLIGDEAFRDCSGLTSVTIPNSVTSIGDEAFRDCSGLTSVTIPNSVTSIGDEAFRDCSGLTSVTIGNSVTSIGYSAFYYCTSLTSVTIGSGVTSIGYSAFYYCTSLTSVTIPNNVTSIGNQAFSYCSGLTSVTIGSGVTSIGDGAFSYCSGLTSVIFNADSCILAGRTDFPIFSSCSNLTNITFGNNIKHIPRFLCRDRSGLNSVTIPNSVSSIGNFAFDGCSGLTSVTIGSGVTSIGISAFYNCSSLDTVFLMPSTPPLLGSSAFTNNASGRVFMLNGCAYNDYYNSSSWSNYRYQLRDPVININVSISSSNVTRGTAAAVLSPGNQTVRCDSTVVVQATANTNYHFDHWSNGSTANRDTLLLTGDTSITAYFIGLTVTSSDIIRGSASHSKIGNHLERITATANYGYHFAYWNDGVTENPRTITLTQDSHFVAYFDKNVYTFTFQSDDNNMGIVNTTSVSGEYLDTTMQIYATAIPHYHFVRWNDNNTENPRRFVFDDNRTYTAYFAIDVHTIDVQVDYLAHGTTSGAGSREYGQAITVIATPYSGYQFTHWSDGSTYNPYTFAVLEDKMLTAFFATEGEPWQDTVVLYDTTYVILHDTTYIDVHDTTYIDVFVHDTTVVTDTVTLMEFVPVHDTTYIDVFVHDTTVVTDTVTLTEFVLVHDTAYIDVFVHDTTIVTDTVTLTQLDTINNTVYDTINIFVYDTVMLTDTLWLRDTIFIHDTIYISNEGIDGEDALNAKVYSCHEQIVVEGADGYEVTLFDINGRTLATKQDYNTEIRFNVSTSGTYMLKIGSRPAKKVVVIK